MGRSHGKRTPIGFLLKKTFKTHPEADENPVCLLWTFNHNSLKLGEFTMVSQPLG